MLVPVGNADAMAEAIILTLDTPVDRKNLRNAVKEYSLEASTKSYLRILGQTGLEHRGDLKPIK